jgi:prophage DNA circulation protein
MGWKDKYREASFRDVPFFVTRAEASYGRRVVEHEFPQVDDPYQEDLGRKKRDFKVEGYIVGEDYMIARDAMIEASEEPGAGKLVHPYLGTMRVVCKELTVSEQSDEGRMCRIQFVFGPAGSLVFQKVTINTPVKVELTARQAYDLQKSQFTTKFNFPNLPFAQADQALRTINQAIDKIQTARKSIGQTSSFVREIKNVRSAIETTVLNAEQLAEQIINLTSLGILDTDSQVKSAFNGILTLFNFSPAVSADSTDNQAFVSLIQQVAMVTAGLVASKVSFESSDEAFTMRDKVLDKLDEISNDTLDDELFTIYMDLRAAIQTDITARATNLSRLTQYVPQQTLPALVIAHSLYGSIKQEADIISRNHIAHPGFVLGGVAIEVLLDG